jgi:hypothetical protein
VLGKTKGNVASGSQSKIRGGIAGANALEEGGGAGRKVEGLKAECVVETDGWIARLGFDPLDAKSEVLKSSDAEIAGWTPPTAGGPPLSRGNWESQRGEGLMRGRRGPRASPAIGARGEEKGRPGGCAGPPWGGSGAEGSAPSSGFVSPRR